jgi:DNA modification methylase
MTPYYEQDGITIYHGDSRDLLFSLPLWDVVISDPPYGVNLGATKGTGGAHGLAKEAYASYEDTPENFRLQIVPVLAAAILRAKRSAVFIGGQNLQDMPRGSVLGGVYCPAANARHRWGFNCLQPVLFYGSAPNLHLGAKHAVLKSTARAEQNGHPCPKPLAWMEWLIQFASLPSDVVIDPFMGSGTTLHAAQIHGRKAIGIEIEERYCEIAAKRLSQGVLPMEHTA